MNPTLASALWMTLIGMGLVFIALLLLWGLISFIVRFSARMEAQTAARAEKVTAEEPVEVTTPAETEDITQTKKKTAAAAAVAVALQLQAKAGKRPAMPAAEPFSAWQQVMRSNRLNQHSRTYSRKQ